MWQKDFFPVFLHVYNRPSLFMSLIQPLVEFANVGLAIVGPLAFGIRVMNVKTEPGSFAGSRPLEHLQVAVRVPKRRDGTAANVLINGDRLTLLVINEIDLRQPHKNRSSVPQFIFCYNTAINRIEVLLKDIDSELGIENPEEQ